MEETNWNKTTDLKTDPRACCTKEFSPYNQVYRSVVVIPEVQDNHTILRQDMLPSKDTKYIIRYNMALNGLTVTIPENCILEFDGGCLTGGTLVGNDTLILNVGDVDCILDNVTKEGTWRTIEYNKDDTDAMLAEKADKADTYTKEEVDALVNTQDISYDDKLQDYYTKRQSDTKYQELEDMIEPKADKDSLSDVAFSGRYDDLLNQPVIPSLSGYAKESWVSDKIEDMLGVDASGISTLKAILEDGSTASGILTHIARKADSNNVYTKTEVDGIKETLELSIGKKADQASTYTKPDVDLKLDAKANASSLAQVATSGLYSDLINKPVIPSAPKQANWNQTDPTALDYIKNKPTMPTLARVATSGGYNDLIGKPIFKTINGQTITGIGDITISGGSSSADLSNYYTKQETYSKTEVDGLIAGVPGSSTNVQADWNQTNASAADYIKNKPTIPTVPTKVSAFDNDAGYLTSNSENLQQLVNRISILETTVAKLKVFFCKLTLSDGRVIDIDGEGQLTSDAVSVPYSSLVLSAEVGNLCMSIGDSAFQNCSNLTHVSIPNSIKSIGGNAFSGCGHLATMDLRNCEITSVGSQAFKNCTNLLSVHLPDTVTSIGTSAFTGCSSLVHCVLSSSISEIKDNLFKDCSSLSNITIPSSVTKVGNYAFMNCVNLESIALHDNITYLGRQAFATCTKLAEATLGTGITDLKDAFTGCTSLTSINIPSGVTSIDSLAFSNCRSLTNITLPNGVKTIGKNAFNGCSGLTSIILPVAITSIGNEAFKFCSSLVNVTCRPINVPTLGMSVFSGNASERKIYVPSSSLNSYKEATNWSAYADDIYPIA